MSIDDQIIVADLFCGHGGVGHALNTVFNASEFAGFDITDYSDTYPGQFVQADLLTSPPVSLSSVDLVWVSFPCTAYSPLSAIHYGSAEEALEANPRIPESGLRTLLEESDCHYIIENVPRASSIGDLRCDARMNGLAFGLPFDMERHFETSFACPDAYRDGTPSVTMSTSGDQSIRPLAEAKGVPAKWGKQAVRSAIPQPYVKWLLHHCPGIDCPKPSLALDSESGATHSTRNTA